MAYDYELTHKLKFLKTKRAGSVPNLLRIDPLLITILINQNQVLGRKNKNSYRLPEINKGESPKSPPYSNKKDTLFQNVLKKETTRVHRKII